MKIDQIPTLAVATGPTPYPDAADDAKWPGKGPVRVFDWMPKDRDRFWLRREQDQGSVVFVGDSLVGGWQPEVLAKCFPGLKTANRGVGGDVTRGVLFRLQEDVLDVNPIAIVICIGTNDLSAYADPAVVAGNIGLILDEIREANADTPIVLCQIPPRDKPDVPTQPGAVADLNRCIAKVAERRDKVVLLDLFTLLATPEGKLTPEYFSTDGIHIAPAGFARWAMSLRTVFADLGVK